MEEHPAPPVNDARVYHINWCRIFFHQQFVKCHRMSMWYHSFPGTQQTLTLNGRRVLGQQTDPTGTVVERDSSTVDG